MAVHTGDVSAGAGDQRVALEPVGQPGSEADTPTESKETSNEGSSVHDASANQGDDTEKVVTEPDVEAGRGTATKEVRAQDWSGPDDPEDPFNWPHWKKIYHVIEAGLFGFVITFGSSVYTPAIAEVSLHYKVSEEAAILGLSLWTLGLSCGPVLAAPISEALGRRVVYRVTLPASLLLTMGAGFSKTFGSFLVCRFFAGLIGSPSLAVGAGTNADIIPLRWRAYAGSAFLAAPFLGPAVGPIVGGFVAQYKGFRWTQWCILFLGTAVLASSVGMKETYKKPLLKARAKRLGIEPPKQVGPTGFTAVKFLLLVTVLRPIRMLFTEPIVLLLSMYNGFVFALLFAFFTAFPVVFTKVYRFNTYQNGLVFIGTGLGVLLGSVSSVAFDWFKYQKEYVKTKAEGRDNVAPEHRLYAAMAGSLGVTSGLFWFAWTARSGVHWIVPIIATVPFAWGLMCIFVSTALYLVDVYGPLNGASAMAANGLVRYGLGAGFPLFIVQMYDYMGIPWATSLLGFLSLVMLPIPWVFFKFGPKIRRKSAYDTIQF